MIAGRRASALPARLLLLGCLLVVGVAVAVPSLTLIRESLLSAGGAFSLNNYVRVLGSARTWHLFGTTVAFSATMTLFAGCTGLLFAWLAARTDVAGRAFMPVAVLLPYLIPPTLGSISWIFFLSPTNGLVNQLLAPLFGGPVFNIYSFPGMVFVESLYTFPLAFIFFHAALVALNPSLEEASAVCGAGTLATFRTVTLPAMWPAIFSVATLLFIIGLESFDVAWFLGYPAKIYTLSIQVFLLTRYDYPPDIAAASVYGVIALLAAMAMVWAYRAITREQARFVAISGKAYRPGGLALGVWRVPAGIVFYGLIVIIGVLPVLLLAGIALDAVAWPFHLRGTADMANFVWILTDAESQRALVNTAIIALLGASAVVALSFLVAYVTVRTELKFRALLDYLAFLPFGFPGTVLAVGLITALIRTPLYDTIWIMLVAFAVKFLPYGLRNIAGSMMQVHRELEEASFASGAGLFATMRRIMLPLVAPGMLAAWSLLFIVFGRQFSLPIMLSSSGSQVLTIALFQEFDGGQMGHVAAYGILLIVCSLPFLVLARWVAKGVAGS
jgi:iron(III) transport system permease protein